MSTLRPPANPASPISPNQGGKRDRVFAPIQVPLARRRQTFSVLLFLLLYPFGLVSFVIFLLTPFGWILAVPYIMWYLFVDTSAYKGGRPIRWITNSWWTRNVHDYYPARLYVQPDVKYPTSKNYLFCYHPHGVIGLGCSANFLAPSPEKEEAFGGLDFRLHTMEVNFRVPFVRELLLSCGFVDVSKKSLLYWLGYDKGGHASVLVPGGAEESLAPTEHRLTLAKRKGFVKVAFETGCALVPTFTFGEADLYTAVVDHKKARGWMFKLQKLFHVGTPLVNGRGIFNYRAGMMPHRVPLNTVVAPPIFVEKKLDYTTEDVDALHAKYVAALTKLYNENKDRFDPEGKHKLEIA